MTECLRRIFGVKPAATARPGKRLMRSNLSQYGFFLLFVWSCMIITSCGSTYHMKTGSVPSLNKKWRQLDIAPRYHVGLSVYDVKKGKTIFRYRDDNYFTPASNTKIFTMYTALHFLEEYLDAAWFGLQGDSLILWGGGDPGTLYPDVDTTCALVEFIKASDKTIVFSHSHFLAHRFGAGWAWDDHAYSYQCERNAYPIYGNRLWIDRIGDSVRLTPSFLTPLVSSVKSSTSRAGKTEWGENYFYTYNPNMPEIHLQVPITFFKNDMQYCWTEVTGKTIIQGDIPLFPVTYPIVGSPRDTLIKRMMRDSDNFVAEQLLLASSMKALKYMSDESIIESVLSGPLKDLPDKVLWRDGSGLSRYNQMTPRSIVFLLEKILQQKGLEYLTTILPAGGQSGTIKDLYKSQTGMPYVYAKSGTLSRVQCLSGILITKSGKVLLFSWMHNSFPGDSKNVINAMEPLFSLLYERY